MKNDFSIYDVANFFLNYEPMDNEKLQFICYFAQAWHLAKNKKPLVNNWRFEAWIHGAICPELYHSYPSANKYSKGQEIHDTYTIEFLKSIYEVYGHLSKEELRLLIKTSPPWKYARGHLKTWECGRNKISEEDMMMYYIEESHS